MEQDKPFTPPKAFSSYRCVFSIFFLKRFLKKDVDFRIFSFRLVPEGFIIFWDSKKMD